MTGSVRGAGLAPALWAAAAAWLAAGSGACIQSVDLRSGSGEESCPEGERRDPSTGDCAPCIVAAPPPEQACPCAFELRAAPFPYCEGDDVAYDCTPCRGDISACRAYDTATHTTTSCDSIAACCRDLDRDAASEPCCPLGTELDCAPSPILGQWTVGCSDSTCCLGATCADSGDCAVWQGCDPASGRCVPACDRTIEYCCVECDCTCKRIPVAP